jgi:phage terminase small subunit
MHDSLTFRQERFVFEYLKDQNASAAAARAGYTAKNLASQGSELMGNPAIADRIRFEMQSILAELRCSALELMKQRMRAAFFDPGKLLNGWEPVPLDQLDAETRAVLDVSTVLRKGVPVVRVKQADRHKALRALERVHERMEMLNQRYYAKLEREGKLPSLEEIEAMDGGGVQAQPVNPDSEIPENPQVLSRVAPRSAAEAARISGEPQVLSGSTMPAVKTGHAAFPEKYQVLSGGQAVAPDSPRVALAA